ncbi:hypothetical protein PoB_006104300 [Plakobranchus ocellatus]|uniref:Uncharacterized protein n=1 Tax=Plakobranchus ocellatus TaxID=259542 RepID=A0AAV4CRL4_9GAST|nr:hypothetical protein PoB_006104300 [Plakobranchus ocellatus]
MNYMYIEIGGGGRTSREKKDRARYRVSTGKADTFVPSRSAFITQAGYISAKREREEMVVLRPQLSLRRFFKTKQKILPAKEKIKLEKSGHFQLNREIMN